MDGNTDISKIIGLIMENPEIISKIKSLATEKNGDAPNINEVSGESKGNINANEAMPSSANVSDSESKSEAAMASVTYQKTQARKRRKELLCALKPYVTSDRAKAIDTMLSVIDVLDVMKER